MNNFYEKALVSTENFWAGMTEPRWGSDTEGETAVWPTAKAPHWAKGGQLARAFLNFKQGVENVYYIKHGSDSGREPHDGIWWLQTRIRANVHREFENGRRETLSHWIIRNESYPEGMRQRYPYSESWDSVIGSIETRTLLR